MRIVVIVIIFYKALDPVELLGYLGAVYNISFVLLLSLLKRMQDTLVVS